MTKKIGYIRVSTKDQSFDRQEEALKAHGCAKIYREKITGVSAMATRQSLTHAINALEPGDALVVYSIDRLARSVANLFVIVDQIKEKGANLVVISQPIDTTTPYGKMFFTIMGAIAELERDMIRERVAQGQAAKRARGKSLGGRPTAVTPTMYKKIHEMVALGHSSIKIAKNSTAEGYPISSATVRRVYNLSGPKQGNTPKAKKTPSAIAPILSNAHTERAS